MKQTEWMAIMKRDITKSDGRVKKKGLTEKEFIEYLEERFRKLKMDEQRFREEVLAGNISRDTNSNYSKMQG
jgi:hypothetical protein